MKFILGHDRNQSTIFPISIEESISQDNEVRLIDMFVDSLDLSDMGFDMRFDENGRPAYHPKVLLKLYLYGYLNSIRSSRKLEKETKRNIEVMWLLELLSPDHNTISNFRKDNPKAIKKVFRVTVQMAKHFNLIGGTLIAGDSTKLRAQNSKQNNFNKKKTQRHLSYIDNKLTEYEKALSEADHDEVESINKKIIEQKERKLRYKNIEKQFEQTGEKQVSTSDPESRHMFTRGRTTEVAYCVQTTVDSDYKIPIDYSVTNVGDLNAMGNMLRRAKTILRQNEFTALYDKGYHNGSEFKKADDLGIDVLSIPEPSSHAPNVEYNLKNFIYNTKGDFYICPEGNHLNTSGTFYKGKHYDYKHYSTKACKQCSVKQECTNAKVGRTIQRSKYQDYVDNNKERISKDKDYYRQRQAIVEHPYGTIKRQWGFDHIMTKKYKKRAEADVGFIFIAYNIRRLISLLSKEELAKYLKELILLLFNQIYQILLDLKPSKTTNYLYRNLSQNSYNLLNGSVCIQI